MKVKYLTAAGRPRGEAIKPGDEVEVSKDEAERLVAKGIAEPVAEKKVQRAEKRSAKKD